MGESPFPLKQAKHQAELNNWLMVFDYKSQYYFLVGEINGHPKVPTGSVSATSRVLSIDFVSRVAETEKTFYKLKDMNPDIMKELIQS